MPRPREVYTYIIVPEVNKARLRYVCNDAADTLLRTALALRVYRLRNENYPAALSELVAANLLPTVPADPFALPGVPLQYRLLPSGKYELHSIGPDGVSDGGKGIRATGKGNGSIRAVDLSSTGDIVAGQHTY